MSAGSAVWPEGTCSGEGACVLPKDDEVGGAAHLHKVLAAGLFEDVLIEQARLWEHIGSGHRRMSPLYRLRSFAVLTPTQDDFAPLPTGATRAPRRAPSDRRMTDPACIRVNDATRRRY
jgi:hypothetical protein